MPEKNINSIEEILWTQTTGLPGTDIHMANSAKNVIPEPAHVFLEEAVETMKARAKLRDKESGERTAGQIAKVFNAITGHSLSESDAWMFLIVLKIVRSRSGKFNKDDYVDMAAYSGLLGEFESTSRN